ncbi:beta-mannosidase-like [Schistocerca gregaria]|uniref:beta-mannosidase-like n=1 Tax=Schistocerca gregaria TaxID=7010 RepID=UPI00211E44FF|nr:beta-mannosidase-like [Schistocerca gregaria]
MVKLAMTTTMKTLTLALLAAATLMGRAEGLIRLSLDGDSWTASNGNGSITVPASVPGGIYSDLRAAGVLPEDIYYRFNDAEYRWVSYENWTYSTTFQVSSDIKNKRNITLLFNGVDTIADIYLNKNYIGSTENMFLRYFFSVEDYVQEGENILEVRFQSAVISALERFTAEDYIVPPECVPDEYHGECHVNFLRKMQSSFSWDWGPAFPSVSIWKNVELLAANNGYIKNYYVSVLFNETSQMYEVTQHVEISPHDTMCDLLTLGISTLPGGNNRNQAKTMKITSDQLVDPQFEATWYYSEDEVLNWWPNSMGKQYQYRTYAECMDEDGLYTIEKYIGYRRINIVQVPVAEDADKGLTFYLKVNGVPVFAKGSNWIPSHVLAEMSADPNRIRNLLTAAKNANMNMLRIWGGGLYESDLFYQIADEMGIMIWHDFMFACNMYPTNPRFLDNVAAEITEQIVRLMHHPSIVVWAGNNENEGALRDNWYGTGSNFSLYYSDYVKLYVDTIGEVVQALDTTRPFVFSSPSNGLKSIQEGYVSQTPGNSLYGDVHYYNYNDDGWNYTTFPTPRFASEYGFQSLPSIYTLSSIAVPSDLSVGSELMQRRQHHLNGYEEMAQQISRHLPLPEDYDTEENFRTFIYFSQINQAMSTKVETEHYRRNRNKLTDAGEGYTMGALYWQLNDIWEAPSWSSIDFHGNWKMLHYYAKNFFSNVLVSPYITPEGELVVSLISDLPYEMDTVVLSIYVYRWDSFEFDIDIIGVHRLPAATAYDAYNETLENILDGTTCGADGGTKDACLLYFTLEDDTLTKKISPDNFIFLSEINSAIGISDPSLNITSVTGPYQVSGSDTYTYNITVSSNAIAPFVWLEAENINGFFSDNGFIILQPVTELQFYTTQETTAEELESALSVTSVMSSFH